MKFEELNKLPCPFGGYLARDFFPNGYGYSVVRHRYSYGNEQGLYELAVLERVEQDWTLTYNTPITDDVIGYLTEDRVTKIVENIKALPPKSNTV